MLTQNERMMMIGKMKALPDKLKVTIKDFDEARLDRPCREGGWSARQIVHHLADSHMNAFVRFKLTLTEDRPTLKAYNQDLWAKLPDISRTPIQASLDILGGLHKRFVALMEALNEEDWRRSAIHTESGEMTLDDLLQIYSDHGENHIAQIAASRSPEGR